MDSTTGQTAQTSLTTAQLITTGLSHHQSGRFAEAKEMYMLALSSEPENFDALHLLGVLAHQVGKHDLAVELIEKAVHQNSENAVAFNNLGEAYKGIKRLDEAERCYRRALELKPNFAEVCSNLGNALKDLGRLEEAVQVYRQALEIKPDFLLVSYHLGNLLKDLGRLDEAEAAFQQALEHKPDYPDAANGLAMLRLLRGDYLRGRDYFAHRLLPGSSPLFGRSKEWFQQLQGEQRWQGGALAGRRLLLITEHGAGDNLMMMRYLPLIKKLGPERLMVYAIPNLARTFLNFPGIDEVVSMTEPLPAGSFDLYCPMMGLPHLLETTLDTIPGSVPYLRIPEELDDRWRQRMENVHGVKVGLAWGAGRLSASHARRSISLERFAPLLEIPDLQLVNLQKGKDAGQMAGLEWDIFDCLDECKDFLDTAALVQQLDLVITIDSSVAHLAGALSKPVWLLNCFQSEWRWMLERDDSPWYPTMRIFRQQAADEWDDVIKTVALQLAGFVQNQ